MKVNVRNTSGSTIEELELSDDIFGIKPNTAVMHQALIRQLANQRLGTHKAKTRSEVSRVENTSFEKMAGQEKEKGFRERSPKNDRFFRAGRSTWRDVLTSEQVYRIQKDHADMMDHLKYATA